MNSYSGFWSRFIALLIDTIVLLVPNLIFVSFGVGFIGIIISWLYFAIMESSLIQATLGKMALRIIVVDLKGNRISFLKATLRYFSKVISAAIFFIGFLMVAFTDKKQGYHDMIANTFVIKKSFIKSEQEIIDLQSSDVINTTEGSSYCSQIISEKKSLVIHFNSVLLQIIGVLLPVYVFILLFTKNKVPISSALIIVIVSIVLIITGIGFRQAKKWSFWACSVFFSFAFVSVINTFFAIQAPVMEKLGFIPYAGLFIISLYLVHNYDVLNYFKLSHLAKIKLYTVPIVSLILSGLFFVIKGQIGI
jgi:uncharacterized RDD family membrane protein YckC